MWLQMGVNPEEPRSGTEDDKWGAYIEPGKPFIISAWVNNYSDKPTRVKIVCQPAPKLTLQGPAEVEIEVGSWGRKRHDFRLIGDHLTPGEVLSVVVMMDGEKRQDQGKVYLRSK